MLPFSLETREKDEEKNERDEEREKGQGGGERMSERTGVGEDKFDVGKNYVRERWAH